MNGMLAGPAKLCDTMLKIFMDNPVVNTIKKGIVKFIGLLNKPIKFTFFFKKVWYT